MTSAFKIKKFIARQPCLRHQCKLNSNVASIKIQALSFDCFLDSEKIRTKSDVNRACIHTTLLFFTVARHESWTKSIMHEKKINPSINDIFAVFS